MTTNKMKATYTVDEILSQLDRCAQDHSFPCFDTHNFAYAGTRLHAYRNIEHWSIMIEKVGVMDGSAGHHSITTCLYRYGNCLNDPPGIDNNDFFNNTRDGMEGPTFDDEYGIVVAPSAMTIRLRGKPVWIEPSTYHYAQHGIERVDPNRLYIFELLQVLFIEHREKLLTNHHERSEKMWADPPHFLQLEEWEHPDIVETPGENNTFQMLAEAMVAGDPTQFEAMDRETTHFRHHRSFLPYFTWPEDE